MTRAMTQTCRGLTLAIVLLIASTAGCVPIRSSPMPTMTWSSRDSSAACVALERNVARWDHEDRVALEAALQRPGPVAVSALGCELEVLTRCEAPGRYEEAEVHARPLGDATQYARRDLVESSRLATTLEGDCAAATHVVSSVDLGLRERPVEEDPNVLRTLAYQPLRVTLAPLSLEDYDLTGTWQGAERQPGIGPEVWDVTVSVTQQGERVTGVSRIEAIDRRTWVEMHFEGRLEGNVLFWTDARAIRHQADVEGYFGWCYRNGFLIVDPRGERLVGPWRAKACKPGAMELGRRSAGRASLSRKALHLGAPKPVRIDWFGEATSPP